MELNAICRALSVTWWTDMARSARSGSSLPERLLVGISFPLCGAEHLVEPALVEPALVDRFQVFAEHAHRH